MRNIFFILLFCISLFSFSQELKLKVNKNPALTSEIIQLQFIVNDKGNDFIPPPLKNNFNILSGPSNGFQQSYSMINGETTKNIKTTISYQIQAKKEGNFTIPSASIKVNGDIIYSKPFEIRIEKDNSQEANNEDNKDIFVKHSTSKSEIYVGEQINSIYKIYIKEGINIQNSSIDEISYNGFWEDELEIDINKQDREIINGQPYTVIKFRHSILTPQISGKLYIPASETNVSMLKKGRLISNSSFFGPQYQTNASNKSVFTKEKTIQVSPLPSPIPENFYGTVSKDFKITSEIDKYELKTNEVITYKLSFRGNGNINMLESIDVKFPKAFQVSNPNIIDETFVGNYTIGGKKTFEYILIAREAGEFKIPSIKFNYFNPETKKYIQIESDLYNITIQKGKDYISIDTTQSQSQSQASSLNLLKVPDKFTKMENRERRITYYKISIWNIGVLLLILFLIKQIILRRKIDPVANKKRKATRIAIKRLKNATTCIKNDDFDQFFEEIEKALWDYFANKFNVNKSSLSKETVESYFNTNKISEENKLNFISLLNECEFARFSQAKNRNQKMEETLKQAKEIIINVESTNKK